MKLKNLILELNLNTSINAIKLMLKKKQTHRAYQLLKQIVGRLELQGKLNTIGKINCMLYAFYELTQDNLKIEFYYDRADNLGITTKFNYYLETDEMDEKDIKLYSRVDAVFVVRAIKKINPNTEIKVQDFLIKQYEQVKNVTEQSSDIKDDFTKLNKMDDSEFLKNVWKMEIPKLKELLQFLENEYKKNKDMYSFAKGQTKALYKHGMEFYKNRIQFVYDIINDKKEGISAPDFVKEEINNISPIDGMNKRKAINYIIKTFKVYEKLKGFFSDDAWQPINGIIGDLHKGGIPIQIEKTEYYKDNNGNPAGKIWQCEIPFINQNNRPDKLYVRITAAGAGSIREPLNRYDVTFTIS